MGSFAYRFDCTSGEDHSHTHIYTGYPVVMVVLSDSRCRMTSLRKASVQADSGMAVFDIAVVMVEASVGQRRAGSSDAAMLQ